MSMYLCYELGNVSQSRLWACPVRRGNWRENGCRWVLLKLMMTNGMSDDIEHYFNVCFSDFSKWRLVLTDRNNHTWLSRAEKVSVPYAKGHLQPPSIVLLVCCKSNLSYHGHIGPFKSVRIGYAIWAVCGKRAKCCTHSVPKMYVRTYVWLCITCVRYIDMFERPVNLQMCMELYGLYCSAVGHRQYQSGVAPIGVPVLVPFLTNCKMPLRIY